MARQSSASDDLFLLDTLEDYQTGIIDLLNQGQYTVKIFSRELNPLFFNTREVTEAISATARRAPNSSIQLLITEPQALVDENHQLLNLARRLPSKIKIQKLTIDTNDNKAFMIVDDDKVWLQHDETSITGDNTGFINTDTRAEAKQFSQVFDDLWRYSESDIRLKQLSL